MCICVPKCIKLNGEFTTILVILFEEKFQKFFDMLGKNS